MFILLVGAALILGSFMIGRQSERRLTLLVGLFIFVVGLYLRNS